METIAESFWCCNMFFMRIPLYFQLEQTAYAIIASTYESSLWI
jgi:hypothetical protein